MPIKITPHVPHHININLILIRYGTMRSVTHKQHIAHHEIIIKIVILVPVRGHELLHYQLERILMVDVVVVARGQHEHDAGCEWLHVGEHVVHFLAGEVVGQIA